MQASKKPFLVVIVGPTASGKTELSIELAKKMNGEIISGDSMQVYRQMNIGTAKVTETEMEGIPHYLIDILKILQKEVKYLLLQEVQVYIFNL